MTSEVPEFLLQRRPKGWPPCAARAWGGAVLLFIVMAVEWTIIYENLWVEPLEQLNFLFIHVFYITPISIALLYVVGLPLNSGYVFAIKIFHIMYRIILALFYITILLIFVLAFFIPRFGMVGLTAVIPSAIILPIIPFIMRVKRNCKWLDLNSQPADWELPSLAKDRARIGKP